MLINARHLAGVADGSITLAFRRWASPRVRAGTRLRTGIGVIEIDDVRITQRLTSADARRAGYESVAALQDDLDRGRAGDTYRIALHLAGPDPRVELREHLPEQDELAMIINRLQRLDRASSHGPWTTDVLRAINDHPGVRAPDLANGFGRETLPFKADVRKLKELGLTESLPVGYRVSPRGRVVLAQLEM